MGHVHGGRGLGLFELTLLAAIMLRVSRTATMVLTTVLTLPLILVAALVLYAINHGGFAFPVNKELILPRS